VYFTYKYYLQLRHVSKRNFLNLIRDLQSTISEVCSKLVCFRWHDGLIHINNKFIILRYQKYCSQ